MTVSYNITPRCGWGAFDHSEEVLELLVTYDRRSEWHYLNPTANTCILESHQTGDSLYFELNGNTIVKGLLQVSTTIEDNSDLQNLLNLLEERYEFRYNPQP